MDELSDSELAQLRQELAFENPGSTADYRLVTKKLLARLDRLEATTRSQIKDIDEGFAQFFKAPLMWGTQAERETYIRDQLDTRHMLSDWEDHAKSPRAILDSFVKYLGRVFDQSVTPLYSRGLDDATFQAHLRVFHSLHVATGLLPEDPEAEARFEKLLAKQRRTKTALPDSRPEQPELPTCIECGTDDFDRHFVGCTKTNA